MEITDPNWIGFDRENLGLFNNYGLCMGRVGAYATFIGSRSGFGE